MLINVDRLLSKMDQENIDGIVATTFENVYYLTGIRSIALQMFPYEGQCYAVISRSHPTEPYFVSSRVEVDQVINGFPSIRKVLTFGTFFREMPNSDIELTEDEYRLKKFSVESPSASGPLEALKIAIEDMNLSNRKIGIDELGLKKGLLEELKDSLPNTSFVEASDQLRWVRRVKTPDEILLLTTATRVAEYGILAAISLAREGVTEEEMMREFERSIVSQGGTPKFSLIRFGRNGVGGQIIPDRTPLQKGETIWFDVGCTYQGYWADIARNFSFGDPNKRTQEIYQSLLKGEQYAIENITLGMTGGQIFDCIVEAVHQAGFPQYRRHHVGHGIGLEVYEKPLLAENIEDAIEENMVLNVETPYYEFGLGALHIEDPILIGKNGNILLSKLDRNLNVLA